MKTIVLSAPASIILYCVITTLPVFFITRAYKSQNKNNTKLYLFLTFIVMVIPAYFRYNVGLDYALHFKISDSIMSLNSLSQAVKYWGRLESSFGFIAFIFGKIGLHSGHVLGFYAFFTQLFMLMGIWGYRDKVPPMYLMLLYMSSFYYRSFNMFRQYLAISIIFFALKYLLENKKNVFVFFVIIASIFHKSALISIFMFLYFKQFKGRNKLIVNFLCYIVPIIMLFSINVLFTIVAKIPYLSMYITETDTYTSIKNEGIFTLGFLLLLIVCIVYIWYGKKINNECERNLRDSLLNKAMYCEVLYFILDHVVGFAARIIYYYSFFSILSISSIANRYHKSESSRRFTLTYYQLFIIIYAFLLFIRIMANNGYGQLPYSFWF